MAKKEEIFHSYIIPYNFIDEGKALGGMVKTRNLVEGCLLAAIFAIPMLFLVKIIHNLTLLVFIGSVLILPPLVFGVIGINGDPLSVFIVYALKYKKSKRLISFNSKVKFHERSDLENINEGELPRDKILRMVNSLGKKRESMEDNEELIDEEFIFDDDIEEIKKKEAEMKKAMKEQSKEEEMLEILYPEEEDIFSINNSNYELDLNDNLEIVSGIEIIDNDQEIIDVSFSDFEDIGNNQVDITSIKTKHQKEEEQKKLQKEVELKRKEEEQKKLQKEVELKRKEEEQKKLQKEMELKRKEEEQKKLQRKIEEEMAFLEVQKRKEDARKGIWICPNCQKTNISNFCAECGSKKPENT